VWFSDGVRVDLFIGKVIWSKNKETNRIIEIQGAPPPILIRRKVIDIIGGLDELFFRSFEDADFCFKVRNIGYKIVYNPYAKSYHKIPSGRIPSLRRVLPIIYHIMRNRIIFMKRYSKSFTVFLLIIPFYVIYYTFWAICLSEFTVIKDVFRGVSDGLRISIRI
jgi:GT2 family glycosyltransferase